MDIESGIQSGIDGNLEKQTQARFKELIQVDQYVGDLFSINYQNAKILVHDKYRNAVGGIPSLAFLIATRITHDDEKIKYEDEDSSFILLRVMDATQLPSSMENERIRVETAQRVSGESSTHWDSKEIMDPATKNQLSHSAIQCRIIGTFYFDMGDDKKLKLKFGSDISNFYPNQCLKIYKPSGKALEKIVNYVDESNLRDNEKKFGNNKKVKIGHMRYASTNRKFQAIDDVPVHIYPVDLLSQKTALFGMTRTGKSNATKIIAKSVYELRHEPGDDGLKIGQLIFDPNGEYANDNVQDGTAIKDIWEETKKINAEVKKEDEVVTYGITPKDDDPDRKMMLFNFYDDNNLDLGKEIINGYLTSETAKYIKSFSQVDFIPPESGDPSSDTRYKRRVLAYRSLLCRAGFPIPEKYQKCPIKGLFNKDLLKRMKNFIGQNASSYHSAAEILGKDYANLDELSRAFQSLHKFMSKDEYESFETLYIKTSSSGQPWADEDLEGIIGMYQYKGSRLVKRAKDHHDPSVSNDYADDIYDDLKQGKLVIIDQATGDQELNKSTSRRVMRKIFDKNKQDFIEDKELHQIIIYAEEAHNLLPSDKEKDLKDIWVRTAKEGAKLGIGLVYATQEVSSIQKNILKNTANWFIAHLNNTDETKELCKYYDFADFEPSIRRAQDKGFLRIKTLSNPFVIPVQVDKFQMKKE